LKFIHARPLRPRVQGRRKRKPIEANVASPIIPHHQMDRTK
jgi:hypothetical protein